MTKKSSMRTKVERNCKKMAPQKVNFSLPSPKVVLNADDCARLLDSMGKASVLLVEKEGQVMTATSRSTSVQSPSMSPPLVVPPKYVAATQTKIYKNWTSVNSTSSTKQIESIDTTAHKRSSTDGTQIDHLNSTVQSRQFLKPPKKRRGIDKKFEETAPTPIVCNSGEVVHCVASFAGHLTDASSAQISSDASLLTLPLNDELPKHRVEHLLQQQELDPAVNINNNQKQVSGAYSHSSRPYVLSSNNSQTSSSEDATSVSLPSSVLMNLDNYEGRTAYTSQLYTHHPYSAALQPSCNHTYLNHPGSVHCAGSLPLSHLVSIGKTTQVDNFQQLPEQIEPMNLSTSCKPVVGLVSLQASSTTDSRTAEDVSAAILQEPFTHVSTESNYSCVSTVSEESKFVCEGTATETVNPQDKLPETAQDLANLTVVSSDFCTTKPEQDHIYDCMRTTENSGSESVKGSTAVDPSAGSQLSCKAVSTMSVEVPYEETQTVPLPTSVQNPVVELSSGQCVELNDSSPLGQNTQISSLLMQSPESSAPTILASSTLSQELHPPGDNNLIKDCKELSTANESAAVKKNKKTTRKKEIPMDEVSCTDRIQRYSLTIDDVIANFVYILEPVEEFSLTEEEEAAIRNQFETVQDNSKTDSIDDNMTDNQSAIAECSGSTINPLGMQADEPSVGSDILITVRPPKKRPTALKSEKTAESQQELQETVEHIDSVLAFVATDYSSSVLPAESSCSSDSKKQKKLKKKPSGDLSQEDSKRKKVKSESSCNKTGAEKNTDSANTVACLIDEGTQLKNGIVSGEKSHAEDARQVSKPKKVRKRKSENTGPTLNLHNAVKLAEVSCEVSEENIEPCFKKATVREKVKPPKKKKTDNIPPVDCVTSLSMFITDKDAEDTARTPSKMLNNSKRLTPVKSNTDQIQVVLPADSSVDKEGVCQNRAETSDIGESIASTSGGSEQNTPVHEPESKDEITCTDAQMTDKENHDTGLESGGDDTVRRYKKRLDFVKCNQCSHQARGRSALSRHMKKVHMLDVMMPFKCEHCSYGSTKMASLNRHLFTHGVFPCSRCSFVATERVKLTEHTAEQHKDKLDVRMCKVCNRYIKCDKITIEQHTVECQGPKPYRCSECEKEFKYASSLRVHYHTHFPDQPKRFKCEQCDYRTNYKANLHKHNKNMHASRDHDVQCPDCGKLFSTEDNMKRHRKVHTLNRPFSCGTCEKKFKTSGALKGHQLIHTATRPYPCNIPGCSRTFRTPKFLKSHQEEFHHLIPKKFFCSVEGCNYSFFKRSHLKRHTITHTGERNFHCTWPGCSKSFRHSDNLKVHFRAHTNEKPFQCHLCDFKCKQKNSLFWHKKRVHQIVDFSVSQIHMEVKLKPAVTEHHLKKVDAVSDVAGAEIDQAIPSAAEKASGTFVVETVNEVARVVEEVASDKGCNDSLSVGVAEVKRETAHLLASIEHDFKTVAGPQEEPGSLDLYEFKSDDESGDEVPGSFRRDRNTMNGLAPLPPPPKELLRKNEILEMREREKKEKAEKKEQERKEKAERKEQEKNERAEKKNLERKMKAELKELEKLEKLKKIEQEKKEKIEKKELEKKEKDEKKELEKKEKLEKKELDMKGKIEKKELKKKEQIEKKQQELKEKIEKREQEKREKAEKREQEKKEKMEKKLTSRTYAVKKGNDIESRDNNEDGDDEEGMENRTKSCSSYSTRRKSPNPASESSVTANRKLNPGRRKLPKDTVGKSVLEKSVRVKAAKKADASSFKKKVLSSKKGETKKSSFAIRSLPRVRSVARKVKRVVLKKNLMRRCKKKGKLSPPKRKPSARIKANNKAKTTVTKQVRGQKPSSSGLHIRKSVRKKAVLICSEVNEVESKAADIADVSANTDDQNLSKSEEIQAITEDSCVLLNSDHEKSLAPPVRSSSPASSEEVMLQGKASPYRDFSDTENQEEQTGSAGSPLQISPEYPDAHKLSGAESDSSTSEESDDETVTRNMCQPAEEFSDDEVSNDIPLTPPRAPAPPPVESSEDELELEPEHTPFSVPGPSTPFSVPGPNTPFSIPPPTNLMQQHSVHSEDAPMSAVLSVPPGDAHSQGSVDMQQSIESAEMHPHESVDTSHSHGSVEMHHPPGSAEIPDSHNSMTVRSHKSVEVLSHGSVEMVHSHGSVEMLCHSNITESVTHADQHVRTPDSIIRDMSNNSESAKYELSHSLQEQTQADADKEYFDQYLKNLSAANNRAAIGLEPSPNGLQHLEAMVCKSHLDSKEMSAKSPISCLPTSVITSLESLPLLTNGDLRARMDSLVLDRHHESFYTRETPSSLPRLPDHQTPLPTSAMGHSPAFDAFSSLNSLTAANTGRENSYLRQPENLFSTPPVTSTFIAEAMFQRQAMATPFLPPQPCERSSLSRIPDATPLRSSSSSSFLRRSGTVPGPDMFSSPAMAQNMPRHPFANAWTSQEVRPAHWQTPYLAHQPNMAATGSFFPSKDNYLTGRDFMFDPSVRPSTERSMFSSISSSQSQDSYQLDRFDLSNYFPNAMTPYGSSTASLEYSRTAHAGTAKPFDERYRQTAASAAISDFRGLPPAGGSSDMFPGFPSVNTGFNLYAGNAMSYHTPHMTENVNSAFLTHSSSAQQAMFERDYAAAAAHRSFYPQNTPYPFVDERQYHSTSKLGHGHPVAPTPVPQERDLISRSAAPESQMQDPYRSLLYRY